MASRERETESEWEVGRNVFRCQSNCLVAYESQTFLTSPTGLSCLRARLSAFRPAVCRRSLTRGSSRSSRAKEGTGGTSEGLSSDQARGGGWETRGAAAPRARHDAARQRRSAIFTARDETSSRRHEAAAYMAEAPRRITQRPSFVFLVVLIRSLVILRDFHEDLSLKTFRCSSHENTCLIKPTNAYDGT